MANDTIRISEMEENQNVNQNDLLEISTFDSEEGRYVTKKMGLSRFAHWVNSFLGKLVSYFQPENITLTETVDRLYEKPISLEELSDVYINHDTLEPRASGRFNSALIYNTRLGKWTNEVYPFIEYEGVIRGNNKTPIITTDPETGLPVDEHIIIPAGVNIYTQTEVFVHIDYYGNFPTILDFVDVQSAEGNPKPKQANITFAKSPYEMTGDINSYMLYKLRIWT